ncbi:trigger factor [Leeuwenhoekiella sp. A16]|uniref:trigger factor n=1 Tax=unclassified Leeuwenhoekiella TaxID=2615029 RepID=UPI003A806480
MNITRENIDELNAVLKVDIAKTDYSGKVEKVLKDYRKSANIPGFRKGHVPMGLVQKQYGKAVLVDEVNKLLQDALQKYLTEEKLDVLGNPLPKDQDNLDWDAGDYSFEFELGLAPKFDVDLSPKEAITSYKVVADDKMIDNQLKTIQKQYGKIVSKEVAEEGDELTGSFKNEDEEIDNKTTLELEKLKGKKNLNAFVGAKVGDVITVKTKGLFAEAADYYANLKISEEDANEKDVEVSFTVEEVNKRELADFDQELFDKLYGKDAVKSVTELKEKIKQDAESQFEQQADQQLLNAVTENLIENTKFELPSEFLKKWIQKSGEKELSFDEAVEEFDRSEKGLRYQLIEGKIISENNLQVTFEELKAYAKEMIKAQMAQYGQLNPDDQELDNIAARILGNQDEVRRLSEQLMNKKLLDFFKENVNLETKEVTFDEFVKEVYK